MRTASLLLASTAVLLSLPAPAQPAAPAAAAAISTSTPETPILIHRVEPKWPREALQENVSGAVRARLTIDAQGRVTDVVVLRAYPRRLFERPVVEALSQWRYNEGAAGRSAESEITFQLAR